MTHPASTIDLVLRLADHGGSAEAIGQETGVPRRTVADWIAGRVPRSRPATCRCGGTHISRHALPAAYVYLLGLYLGDGYLASHSRGVHKLRVTLDAAYPGIIRECAAAIAAVVPRNAVRCFPRVYGDVEVYAYSTAWTCLLPQHGPGKKHERSIRLEPWQVELVARAPQLLLRGLIHSDGCRFMNTGRNWRHPRYAFSNVSSDIRGIFCDACHLMDLRPTLAGRVVYVSREADVARLDAFIGPKL